MPPAGSAFNACLLVHAMAPGFKPCLAPVKGDGGATSLYYVCCCEPRPAAFYARLPTFDCKAAAMLLLCIWCGSEGRDYCMVMMLFGRWSGGGL